MALLAGHRGSGQGGGWFEGGRVDSVGDELGTVRASVRRASSCSKHQGAGEVERRCEEAAASRSVHGGDGSRTGQSPGSPGAADVRWDISTGVRECPRVPSGRAHAPFPCRSGPPPILTFLGNNTLANQRLHQERFPAVQSPRNDRRTLLTALHRPPELRKWARYRRDRLPASPLFYVPLLLPSFSPPKKEEKYPVTAKHEPGFPWGRPVTCRPR